MERRMFLGRSVAAASALGGATAGAAGAQPPELPRPGGTQFTATASALPHSGYSPFTTPNYYTFANDLVIERPTPGKPHQVLAAIQPHSDDVPLYCGGTVAKLVDEGYTWATPATSFASPTTRPRGAADTPFRK